MDRALPYGSGEVVVTGLPDVVAELLPAVVGVPAIAPEQLGSVLAEKVQHPIGAPKLSDFVAGATGVTIVIPDKTRKAGQRALLGALLEFLTAHGLPREHVRVLIGLGTHPQHSEFELEHLLGADLLADLRTMGTLAESSGQRTADFVDLGSTSRGTRVKIHRWLLDDGPVIVTGSITYHYYAGYSGGRKGVLPGCAAEESIRASHQLAFRRAPSGSIERDPGAGAGRLTGNPIYEDQLEAVRMLPRAPFLINTITNPQDQIIELVAGDLIAAHDYGSTLVDAYYQASCEYPYDLVVASAGGFPSDINLIQSHKALDNAVRACVPGGTVLLLAECSQSLGNPNALDWAALGTADAVLQRLGEQYEVIGGTVEGLLRKCEEWDVRLVSALPDHVASRFGFGFCSTWMGSTVDVSGLIPPGGRVALMPAAGITMPVRHKGSIQEQVMRRSPL